MPTPARCFAFACVAMSIMTVVSLPPATCPADMVDLSAGSGTLAWDTDTSVVANNTSVTHPMFTTNRHSREGWFLFVNQGGGFLHEFTGFTKISDGISVDTMSSTYTMPGSTETFQLNLTYELTAVGPNGLPELTWNADLLRPTAGAVIPFINVRLFNLFDYNIGDVPGTDSALATQNAGPPSSTIIDVTNASNPDGQRGAFFPIRYQADSMNNILGQIFANQMLSDSTAPGAYDVAGAFEWELDLGIGPGRGFGFGGFGGFGAFAVPEPSGVILALGFTACFSMSRRRKNRN